MHLIQWLRHVRRWLSVFPVPGTDYHLWIGFTDGGMFTCHCGAEHPDGPRLGETFTEHFMPTGEDDA